MTANVFVDPSIAGPDMLFSTGAVADGAEQFQAALPSVSGNPDPGWNITQWNTSPADIFQATSPILGDTADTDLLLGKALASWHTGSGTTTSTLAVYGGPGDYTYRLGATGGSTRDTFLQTTGYGSGANTFDHPITFTADERVVSAAAGSGTAVAFNSFTVFFNASGNPHYDASLPTLELFLQVPLTDFRGQPAPYETIAAGHDYQAIYDLSSQSADPVSAALVSDASVNALAFAADNGPLHTIRIDLNQALLRMVDAMAAQDPTMATSYLDLSRWSVGSVYSGVETSAGGSGAPGSLTIDIAHPTLSEDDTQTVSSSMALSTVQSIDNNSYANVDSSSLITTLRGTSNSIVLAPGFASKTVASHGTDTISVGDAQTVQLHAVEGSLDVIGHTATYADISIDGAAPVTTSGALGTLSVSSSADQDSIGGSVDQASLSLSGNDDTVLLSGRVDADLSGRDGTLSAGGGTVSLYGDGNRIDLNDGGTQTIFLNGRTAHVTEAGTGSQIIVGAAAQSGSLQLDGGAGTQTLWTGGTTTTVTAGAGSASLTIHAQSGSSTDVQLGAGHAAVDDEGGAVTVQGSSAGGDATVQGGTGTMTVWGGAERLVAIDGGSAAPGNTLQVQGGSGAQTIFGGREALTVLGNHAVGGLQTIVNGNDTADAVTVFGGRTEQTIWTGQAHDTIVASTLAGDASGSIHAIIQGGASSYWSGTESASLDNQGGILDAFLGNGGHVDILAEMTRAGTTTLHGFDSRTDTLTLGGVSDLSKIHLTTGSGGTMLSIAGDPGRVMLTGLSHVTLMHGSGGVLVLG